MVFLSLFTEEAQAQYRRLEEERAQQEERALAAAAEAQAREEARERAMADLQQRLAGHDEEVQTRECLVVPWIWVGLLSFAGCTRH